MRDLRQQQKAQARVSRELAGTDTKRQEAEFLEYARKGVATDEFDKLIGLAGEADAAAAGRRRARRAGEEQVAGGMRRIAWQSRNLDLKSQITNNAGAA